VLQERYEEVTDLSGVLMSLACYEEVTNYRFATRLLPRNLAYMGS